MSSEELSAHIFTSPCAFVTHGDWVAPGGDKYGK